ncbi:hypothetical protein RB195_011843 [Necator americanus]|uniref:Uncharacterized protein n=1 Tax=Necator americanus TaxID=51031 RepID=A0ABR1D492_NECAM
MRHLRGYITNDLTFQALTKATTLKPAESVPFEWAVVRAEHLYHRSVVVIMRSSDNTSCPGGTGRSYKGVSQRPNPLGQGQGSTSQRPSLGLASPQVEDTSYEPCALRSRRRGKNLWSACELQKLPLEVERYRQVCGRVQWAPLAQAWERSRNCNDAQRSINALKAAYAKLCKRNTQATGATVPLPVVNKNVTERNREESMERGNPSQETSISDVGGRSQTTPEACVTTSRTFKLWSLLLQRFEKFYATATTSEDRVPIRRPKGEIPADLLEIGNGILNAKMPERLSNGKHFLSKLNVSVYAIARAIAATADKMNKDEDSVNQKRTLKEAVESRGTLVSMITSLEHELDRIDARRRGERTRPPSRKYLRIAEMHDVRGGASLRRLLRELMDRLATTQSTIKKLEDTMRRQFVRHKGSSYVVRDRADRGTTSVVPVTSIREYWEPIVGEHKLFQVSPAQKERAGDQGESETPRKSVELNEEEWRRLLVETPHGCQDEADLLVSKGTGEAEEGSASVGVSRQSGTDTEGDEDETELEGPRRLPANSLFKYLL